MAEAQIDLNDILENLTAVRYALNPTPKRNGRNGEKVAAPKQPDLQTAIKTLQNCVQNLTMLVRM